MQLAGAELVLASDLWGPTTPLLLCAWPPAGHQEQADLFLCIPAFMGHID